MTDKSRTKDWKFVILFILAWLVSVMAVLTLIPFASEYLNWVAEIVKQ